MENKQSALTSLFTQDCYSANWFLVPPAEAAAVTTTTTHDYLVIPMWPSFLHILKHIFASEITLEWRPTFVDGAW